MNLEISLFLMRKRVQHKTCMFNKWYHSKAEIKHCSCCLQTTYTTQSTSHSWLDF